MKILMIGSGAREHALVHRLSCHHELFCAPGNPGIAQDVEIFPVLPSDQNAIVDLALLLEVDLAVVGPENPLVDGLSDQLRQRGVTTFGPSMAAARLEGSKAFSKQLMHHAHVPTANFMSFDSPSAALEYARAAYGTGGSLAVKASGNALGRGVAVCESFEDASEAIHRCMVERVFGEAGAQVVLEERLVGREFSLLTIVGSNNWVSLPVAQDYKRALDQDQGPNTGGMGSFSPCDWATPDLIREVEDAMVRPILRELEALGTPFTGLLFTGVMIAESGPKCLEYNVRFGDPETQSLMMRIEGDFGMRLLESATGEWIQPISATADCAVTVVVASSGYPESYRTQMPVRIGPVPTGTKLFYAGVSRQNGVLVTSGGRVVAASAVGETLELARTRAYAAAGAVQFEGAYFRTDIAELR